MIVPLAVDTVELCTPDDGRVCRPKHVEWTKQRNKIHCIHLHLLVISNRTFDYLFPSCRWPANDYVFRQFVPSSSGRHFTRENVDAFRRYLHAGLRCQSFMWTQSDMSVLVLSWVWKLGAGANTTWGFLRWWRALNYGQWTCSARSCCAVGLLDCFLLVHFRPKILVWFRSVRGLFSHIY